MGAQLALGRWEPSMYYDHAALMLACKESVVTLLRTALFAGRLLCTEKTADEVGATLVEQEARDWIMRVQTLAGC